MDFLEGSVKEPKLKLNLKMREIDDVTVVHCEGRIAYGREAASLSSRVADLPQGAQQVVLELSGVEVIDSAGLGELIRVLKWAEDRGCSIKLAAPTRRIRRLLELTNLASIFEIHSTPDEAVMAFREQLASSSAVL